jgi:hypothetical protein
MLVAEFLLQCLDVLFVDVLFTYLAECLKDEAADLASQLHALGAGLTELNGLVADPSGFC